MCLALDWATLTHDEPFAALLRERSLTLYGNDVGLPLWYEPSGHDFLSPALAQADLMRRIMPPEDFTNWLERALPTLRIPLSITPVGSTDPADGKLAHLDGLNLSRAWMLEGIASAWDAAEPEIEMLHQTATAHAKAGLSSITSPHYAGTHWLGTFATYLMTHRGIALSQR